MAASDPSRTLPTCPLALYSNHGEGPQMEFSDERWTSVKGGYREPFDPRPTLEKLLEYPASDQLWMNLWEELHHQGDVDIASYASVSTIAQIAERDTTGDWNAFALAATIEEARHMPQNPPIPQWLAAEYASAWERLFRSALRLLEKSTRSEAVLSAFSVLALHKGQRSLGKMALLTEDERIEMLDE